MAEPEQYERIYVIPHPSLGDRVALSDLYHPEPIGEIFISGADPKPVEVFLTDTVQGALTPPAPGQPPRLVRVEGAALKKAQEAHEARLAVRQAARDAALADRAAVLSAAGMLPAATRAAPPTAAEQRAADKRLADAEARAEKAEAELAAMRAKAEADKK